MKKNILYCIVIILDMIATNASNAQNGNIWYFGDSAGISFNSGLPVALTDDGALNSIECSSSICDSNSNLQFYAGSKNNSALYITSFNRQHQIMLNGDSIVGNYSITQGALILPYPDNPNKYLLFSIGTTDLAPVNHLTYSVIDMSLGSGLGSVTQKNTVLADTVTEKMIAVRHANGRDWWVIAHKDNSNEYMTFLVEPSGISGPFIQSTGTVLGGFDLIGQMAISEDGSKLCLVGASGVLEISDFDRCTGIISNLQSIAEISPIQQYYGCSFSPNGTRLYVSVLDTLFQYDLTASNIRNSKQVIFVIHPSYGIGQHKIFNGKIYIVSTYGTFPNSVYDSIDLNLSVINDPDSLGFGCHYMPYSIYLGGRRCLGGLPNNPNYRLGALMGSLCDTLDIGGINAIRKDDFVVDLYPNPNNGNFILTYHLKTKANFIIQDLVGRTVFSKHLDGFNGSETIFSSNLCNNIYFWEVIADHEISVARKIAVIK